MKPSIERQSSLASRRAAALALTLTLLGFGVALRAQTYVLTDLGTSGERESYTTAINSSNVVVGYSVHDTGMAYRAWLWSEAGGRVELGGFGGNEARAIAVNDAGQIAGFATDANEVAHGFIYDATNGLADLGTPPVAGGVYPQAINSLGHIAGFITTASNSVSFLWKGPGQWILQATLPGADEPASASAYALNDSGELVGTASWLYGGSRAFVTETNGGALTALGTLGGETGTAYGINNAGQVVGEVEMTNGSQHAFILDADRVRDLGTLGGADSTAFFINDVGDVAGSARTAAGVDHAFIWNAGAGMDDLQNLIAPTLGWTLNEAHAINPAGLIVGNGTLAGHSRAFLLTPRSGPDTNPPVAFATINTNFIGSVYFYPITLALTVWDDIAVEAKTIFTSSVRVTGPNGYSALAAFTGRTPYSSNVMQVTATYQINPPGGTWDGADTGSYTISLEPDSVRDIAGNFIPAQTLATFTVAIQTNALAFAYGPTALLPGEPGDFTFTAQGSYPSSSGDVFAFVIDWYGDGTPDETVNSANPLDRSHNFSLGFYKVTMTATDPHGKSASASLEVLVNPLPGSWTSGTDLAGRYNGAGFYAQGRLYYFGGDPQIPLDGGDSQVDYFPLSGNAWQSAHVLDGDLYGMGAGVDNLGRIVIFGGHSLESSPSTGGFTYTPTGGRGNGIASRGVVQNGFAWCADNLNRLYCIGGSVTNVFRYSGSGNTWTSLAALPVARTGAAAVYDGQGRILVVGGGDAQVFAYDIAADAWTQLANAPQTHNGQRAALGANGLVYVLNDTSLLVFDPIKNTWGLGPPPAFGHDSLVAGTNGLLYAFGGYSGTMEILDPFTAGSPPYFITTPSGGTLTGRVGQAWSYQAIAGGSPPPGVFLATAPAGMTVNANGLLTWMPVAGQQGANQAVLRATNSVGVAQQKFTINVGPPILNNDTTPPSTVSNLHTTTITDTSATLAWDAATDNVGVAGYRLYTYKTVCTSPRCTTRKTVSVLQANNLSATTITRTGLNPGGYYKFGVAAFDAAGNESPHTKISFYTLSPPRIIPGWIAAQSLQYAVVGEPWQQQFAVVGNPLPTLSLVSGPARMSFSNNAVIWNPVQGGPGTNVELFTLHVGNTISNYDQTFPLAVYPAGTDLVPPSAVTGVQITEIGADHVGLSWNPSTDNYGIAGYWVTATIHYRARNCARGCNRSRLVVREFFPGTNTTAFLGGLEPNTRYYLTIQAVDTAGNAGYLSCGYTYAGYCSAATFTTTPLLAVTLNALPNGDLLFAWNELQPYYYRVGDYYAYTLVGNSTLATNAAAWIPVPGVTWPITNTSIEISPINASNTFYRVKADYLVQP